MALLGAALPWLGPWEGASFPGNWQAPLDPLTPWDPAIKGKGTLPCGWGHQVQLERQEGWGGGMEEVSALALEYT